MASNTNKKEKRAIERERYKERYRILKELRIWIAVLLAVSIGLGLWAHFSRDEVDYRKMIAFDNGKYTVSAMTLSFLFYDQFYGMVEDESFHTDGFGVYGLDPAKPLKGQMYTELRSYYNELMNTASSGAYTTLQYYTMAKEDGLTLGDEEKKLLQAEVDEIASDAKGAGMSLDEYLDYRYCPGMTEKDLRDALEFYYLSSQQYNILRDEALVCTDEEVEEYYDQHAEEFLNVNLVKYEMAIEKDENGEAKEEYVKKADAFCACKTVEEFLAMAEADMRAAEMSEETIQKTLDEAMVTADTSTYNGDLKDWLFDYDRVKGDARAFYSGDKCGIFWVMRSAGKYIYPSVNSRIIYLARERFESDEAIAAKAEEILGYAKATPTDAHFESLVYEYSQDSGSVSYGGMREGVVPGDLNYKCEEWLFAKDRAQGDIGAVELDGNYYIMFLSSFGDLCWQTSAERALVSERISGIEATMENYTEIDQDTNIIDNNIRDDLATDHGVDWDGKRIAFIVFAVLSVLLAGATVWCFVYTARLQKIYGYKF